MMMVEQGAAGRKLMARSQRPQEDIDVQTVDDSAAPPLIPVLVTGIQHAQVFGRKRPLRVRHRPPQGADAPWLDSCDKHRNEGGWGDAREKGVAPGRRLSIGGQGSRVTSALRLCGLKAPSWKQDHLAATQSAAPSLIPVLVTGIQHAQVFGRKRLVRARHRSPQGADAPWPDSCYEHRNEGGSGGAHEIGVGPWRGSSIGGQGSCVTSALRLCGLTPASSKQGRLAATQSAAPSLIPVLVIGIQHAQVLGRKRLLRVRHRPPQGADAPWLDSCDEHRNEGGWDGAREKGVGPRRGSSIGGQENRVTSALRPCGLTAPSWKQDHLATQSASPSLIPVLVTGIQAAQVFGRKRLLLVWHRSPQGADAPWQDFCDEYGNEGGWGGACRRSVSRWLGSLGSLMKERGEALVPVVGLGDIV